MHLYKADYKEDKIYTETLTKMYANKYRCFTDVNKIIDILENTKPKTLYVIIANNFGGEEIFKRAKADKKVKQIIDRMIIFTNNIYVSQKWAICKDKEIIQSICDDFDQVLKSLKNSKEQFTLNMEKILEPKEFEEDLFGLVKFETEAAFGTKSTY